MEGLDAGTTQLDISDLMKFDSSQLKSVDLKTDLRNGDTTTQSLNLHADDKERWLGFHNGDVKLKLNTTEGKASETINTQRVKSIDANAAKNGAISGLADFSATYLQTPRSGNPYKPEEEDTVALDVAQKTATQDHGDTQNLTQQTLFKLKASFHTALDSDAAPKLTEQKSSQNYKYHLINDEERNDTTISQNIKGELTAHYAQQLMQHETVKTYQLAQLMDSVEIPHSAKSESTRHFAAALFDAQFKAGN